MNNPFTLCEYCRKELYPTDHILVLYKHDYDYYPFDFQVSDVVKRFTKEDLKSNEYYHKVCGDKFVEENNKNK